MNKLPNISELAEAILDVMKVGDQKRFKEIDSLVAEKLNIPRELLEQIRVGKRTEYAYRMSWAKQKLKSAKKLDNTGGGNWKRIS
jgi:restriction endonuclease Mrr